MYTLMSTLVTETVLQPLTPSPCEEAKLHTKVYHYEIIYIFTNAIPTIYNFNRFKNIN